MKFDELFNTLMEACYKHNKVKQEAHCGTHSEDNNTKKPDKDKDGVPDWADKKPGEDDNADKDDKKPSGKGKMPAGLAAYHAKKNKKK